jgi:hypothetical protein
MGRNDDGSSAQITLGSNFPYGLKLFSGTYSTLYINNNGNLTFRSALGTYTPTPFPVTNLPMLAAYWGDVDTRGASDDLRNNVYYSTAVPGKFIVTWNYVGYYSAKTNKLNAFQMIITDRGDVGQGDFDLEYRYEQLEWTTGDASGGSNGLGGTPAQMGFDAGDGKNFYRHPDSSTAAILNLAQGSNVGEPGVWRFEVRGGTPTPVVVPNLSDVHLVETINAADIDVDMQSFQTPPTSVTTANGATRIEWAFDKFPANISKDLAFDLIFKNPQPGEHRPLVTKVELSYKDVNGYVVHSELSPETVSVLPSIYQVVPSTDKTNYGANDPVLISSLVSNLSAFPANASVRVTLLDASGVPVSVVGTTTVQQIAAGGNLPFGGLHLSTGTLYAGGYRLLAEVLDTHGAVAASGTSAFSIVAAQGQQAQVTISVDKREYGPFDQVRLADRISNVLANASLDNVNVATVVTRPDGTEMMRKAESLAQLAPNGSKDLAYTLQLSGSTPGQYGAQLLLAKADGTPLAQAATQFTVKSSAESGAGLTGTLQVSPALVHNGKPVKLTFNVDNGGNSAFSNVALSVNIVDPVAQRVIATYPYTASLAVGGAFPGSADWTAIGSDSGSHVAVLMATVGGKELALAQQNIKVLTLESTASFKAASRVLAVVSCDDDDSGSDGCDTGRAQTIDQILTAAGVEHQVATSEAAFKVALRSGRFNTYWLSGKQDKLHGTLPQEVREAVYFGDGALIDGEHDQRNGLLDDLAGVRWKGKFGPTDLVVNLETPVFTAESLQTAGRSGRLELAGGSEQASFDAGVKSGASAIISNTFGAGRVLQYAFDLPSSYVKEARWQPVIVTSLQYVMRPVSDMLAPGASLLAKLGVRNIGPETAVLVSSALPSGADYVSSMPEGSYDSDKRAVSWSFTLANQQAWDAMLTLRAPLKSGDASLPTTVSTVDPSTGTPTQYGQPLVLPVRVFDMQQSTDQAQVLLRAMTSLGKQEARARERMIDDIQSAMVSIRQGSATSLDAGIVKLIGVVDQLSQITSVSTQPVHEALDRAIREAQRRWSATQ